ncbi:hypothetical protein TNCV_3953601 [Trichonephila clavipes]|nr:hypothetical protein TNCV_3953601 [Trichonephila clavipes]
MKQSGRTSIVKTKVADVETTLQRSPMKRPSVYTNIIREFISLVNSDERHLGCSKTAQRVTHHRTKAFAIAKCSLTQAGGRLFMNKPVVLQYNLHFDDLMNLNYVLTQCSTADVEWSFWELLHVQV